MTVKGRAVLNEKKLNMLVQKSHPLLTQCQSTDMTLPEFKILDIHIYLAHVNSHDKTFGKYVDATNY